MIVLDGVGVVFDQAAGPVLRGVDLELDEGELVVVAGPTGSGKSTLLRTLNGLVPHSTGGTLSGRVVVDGRDTRTHRPRDLADLVGWVGQDPAAGFVTDTVEDELAYAMESLGVPPAAMRARVEQTVDLLGLAELRGRSLDTLSGGQAQRVAIGSVLTAGPRVLVLDEPTSALDPTAAEDVLAALARLVHDLGLTVVVAEHRLERVAHHADRVVLVPGGGAQLVVGAPADVLAGSVVAPPVLRLARLAGWSPAPLSVRDARRLAGPLRERLRGRPPGPPVQPGREHPGAPTDVPGADAPVVLGRLSAATVTHGGSTALDRVDLEVRTGSVTALMGRNGAGKSTVLGLLAGLRRPRSGSATVRDPGGRQVAPGALRPSAALRLVGLVPQAPGDLLYADTVDDECAAADRDAGVRPGVARRLLAGLSPGIPGSRHPRDLSEGQRLCLVLAILLAADPPLLLLDEPTRGLDHDAKAALVGIVRRLADSGHAVVLATHDVELAAEAADRVVLLADGRIIVDGPAADVLTGSPAFAPQVARILSPDRWLTVGAVAAALAASSSAAVTPVAPGTR